MAASVHSAPKISQIEGVADELRLVLGSMLAELTEANDEIGVLVTRDALLEAMALLRDKCEYQQLMEIAGVDYPDRAERFEVVYMLLSVTRNHRIRVKVRTDEEHPVPSVTSLWPVAGWLEREVFDMYGVGFAGNSDLRRILTDYGFEGHPQRKDFPLTGYVELRYSEEDKRVVYEPVRLAQDFRSFDFMSPWEGAEYILPGDEKAGQAPGAPTPAQAPPPPAAAKSDAPKGEEKAPTPKTTEAKADTGAGEPANAKAAKTTKPKAAPRGAAPKTTDAPEKPKPRSTRTRKTPPGGGE